MDYEKKYKEALERAKKLHKDAITLQLKQDIKDYEYIFPELKDSEDERIRKGLINGFNECLKNSQYSNNAQKYWHNIKIEDIFAWLEKQGEKIDIANKEYWRGYREGKKEILDKYAELGKQGEQKPQRMISAGAKEAMYDKPAWSEDDEQYLLVCKNALAKYQRTDKWDAGIISRWLENKLKSLKERYTWKPSDEQIKTCKEVYADILSAKGFDLGTVNSELNRLEEKLKKLREE